MCWCGPGNVGVKTGGVMLLEVSNVLLEVGDPLVEKLCWRGLGELLEDKGVLGDGGISVKRCR